MDEYPKSKKWIALLVSLAVAWLLLIVLGGFAISQGYFMRFFYEGIELSRDEYFALAYSDQVMNCAGAEFSLSEGYVGQCFDTMEEVMAFMANR